MPRRRTPIPDWIRPQTVALGHRIATLRRERGYSQDDLADRCGLERRTIQRYENAVRTPSYVEILLIADALSIPTRDLLPPGRSRPRDS